MINPERIPYDNWINSQLSIARFYGGCTFNGAEYKMDYRDCKSVNEDGEQLYKPDLVRVTSQNREEIEKAMLEAK